MKSFSYLGNEIAQEINQETDQLSDAISMRHITGLIFGTGTDILLGNWQIHIGTPTEAEETAVATCGE